MVTPLRTASKVPPAFSATLAPKVATPPTKARLLLDTLPPKNMMQRRWCTTSSR